VSEATAHFEAASKFSGRSRAVIWAVYYSVELAEALLSMNHREERGRAFELLQRAQAEW